MARIARTELRAELLGAGLRCFARSGYRGATLDEIAAEARVTKGAVYWHFRDKADLFESVIRERACVLVADVMQAIAPETSPVGCIRAILGAVFRFYVENPEMATLLGILRSGQDSVLRPEAEAELREFYRTIRAYLGDVVQSGIAMGDFAAGPPDALASWLLATIEGLVLQWAFEPEQVPLRETVPFLIERTLQGLLAPERAECLTAAVCRAE